LNPGPVNKAASVRQRLLNKARIEKVDFNVLLTRYGLERFLYRLGRSKHSRLFILKGAMLYPVWGIQGHRPTMDVDLLGFGSSSEQNLAEIFRDIAQLDDENDAVRFESESVRAEAIRDEMEYGGVRVKLIGYLENARISIQIDVGFGDVVTPGSQEVDYPTLLDMPAPHLRIYPRESVVAEKFQAMVALGMGNSRMKDFYDVWLLARLFDFEGLSLSQAIARTFERRQTAIPEQLPVSLSSEFHTDTAKQTQWHAFLKRNNLEGQDISLKEAIDLLVRFLMPVCEALHREVDFIASWSGNGFWE
jgi:hypothetical protein